MKNWRGGPRGIRAQDKAGATPVSAGFDQGKARERAFGPKDRPSRQREIAAYPNPPLSDLTPECTRRTTLPGPPQPPTGRRNSRLPGPFRDINGSPIDAVVPPALAP